MGVEEEEGLLDPSPSPGTHARAVEQPHNLWWWSLLVAVNLTISTATVFFARGGPQTVLQSQDARYEHPEMNPLLKRTSAYSPVLDQIDLTPKLQNLRGLLHGNDSIFRQEPSPAVDAAWHILSDNIYTAPSHAIVQAEMDLDQAAQAPLDWHRGDDAYLVQYEVFHLIHCLDWLRREVHWSHYYGDHRPSEIFKTHRAHCLGALLERLMCYADVDVIPYAWTKHEEQEYEEAFPNPDFSLRKMCRPFDKVVEWAEANTVPNGSAMYKWLNPPPNKIVELWSEQ